MRRIAAACLALGLLFGLAGRANSTSTLAWSKVVDANGNEGGAVECTDSAGNLFAGFFSSGKITVTKFDQFGAQLWSNSTFTSPLIAGVLIAADSLGNVYVFDASTDTSTLTTQLFKYGPDGSPLWLDQTSSSGSIVPLAIQADSVGVRVAYNLNPSGGSQAMAALYYDGNGMQTGSVTDSTVAPSSAKFCIDTNLLYAGGDPSLPGVGHCKLVKSDGSFLLDFQLNGAFYADSDIADNVYIAANTGGSSPFYQILKYSSAGAPQWVTHPTNGSVDILSAAYYNQVFVYSFTTGLLQLFDPDIVPFPAMGPPTPAFSVAATRPRITADPGGGVVVVTDNVLRRYDLRGTLTWAQTFTIANATPSIPIITVPATSGSQTGPDPVYFAGFASAASVIPTFVGKYVANTAVLALTLSPNYVTGGSPTVGTVKLNAPAGPGGASVALSSSFPSLANPPATLTIPQGSSSGMFAASTPPVDVAGAVTLSATYGGTRRSAIVNVIPATLFSVTTPVSMAKGGTYVTGTVHLTGRAGPAGRSVALMSSKPAAASVPPGVNVAPYASSVNFVVATKHVSANTVLTVTARSGLVTKTTAFTVTP